MGRSGNGKRNNLLGWPHTQVILITILKDPEKTDVSSPGSGSGIVSGFIEIIRFQVIILLKEHR